MVLIRFIALLTLAAGAFTGIASAQTPAWVSIDHGLTPANGYSGLGGIAIGNGTYVVIAVQPDSNGLVHLARSANGQAWTQLSVNPGLTFVANSRVRFLNGKFVFFVTGARGNVSVAIVYSSADGTTWTATDLPAGLNTLPAEFDYGNGRYVVVGGNGYIIGSPDLVSWAGITSPLTGIYGFQDVAYGNGRWFATTNGGGAVATSTDGVTFTAVAGLSATGGYRVEYGNNTWFFYSQINNAVSTDGTTFTTVVRATSTPGGTGTIRALGDRFVANSVTLQSSADGRTWTSIGSVPTLSGFVATNDFATDGHRYYIAGYVQILFNPDLTPIILVADIPTTAEPIVVGAQPVAASAAVGATAIFTTAATGTIQWQFNGANLSGATSATLTLSNVQPANVGIYTATITSGGTTTTQSAILGVSSSAKLVGPGTEVLQNTQHPNGNFYDQILPSGAAVTITADAGQATRTSYIDLNDDIVQVEFSGAGTLSLVLASATGPAAPTKYTQAVNYLKGHAGIVITGANETTNVTVFTVGRATAFDPTGAYDITKAISATNNPANNGSSLFQGQASTSYDGVADLAFIAIQSTNGKFGGVRAADAGFFAASGFTGVYAPGVQFTGPLYLHDLNASGTATPVLLVGSTGDARITGGSLKQDNNRAVQVGGITQLKFTDGASSSGATFTAQSNQARLEQNGTDVTSQVVVNPTPPSGGAGTVSKELTFFAGTNPPYANGTKKTFNISTTTLQFDSTTLTNPTPMTSLNAPLTGVAFTDPATGLTWQVLFNAGAFHEINIMRSGQFAGQWE